MTDDARRVLTEEELGRVQAAKRDAGMCAGCGRALVGGETVWMERLATRLIGWRRRSPILNQAPVGAECASAMFLAATEGVEPERCVTCGRGVYYQTVPGRRRQRATCSRMCERRYQVARAKEKRR